MTSTFYCHLWYGEDCYAYVIGTYDPLKPESTLNVLELRNRMGPIHVDSNFFRSNLARKLGLPAHTWRIKS